MKRYQIGTIAKLLGLSSEMLRTYEKMGIVSVQRDPENGYRYFTPWDVNYLLDCAYYRSFGFPLHRVKDMLHEADLQTMEEYTQQQIHELMEEAAALQNKLNHLRELQEHLQSIRKQIGCFSQKERPALLFQYFRENDTFAVERDAWDAFQYWNQNKPEAKNTVMILPDATGVYGTYRWGYSLPAEQELRTPEPLRPHFLKIDSCQAIYTIFCAHGEHTFLEAFQSQVVAPLHRKGCPIASAPVVGNLLVRAHGVEGLERYIEVWIPLETS